MNHMTDYFTSTESTTNISTENHLALSSSWLIVSMAFPFKCLKRLSGYNHLIHTRYYNMVVYILVFSINASPIICQDSDDFTLREIDQNSSSL